MILKLAKSAFNLKVKEYLNPFTSIHTAALASLSKRKAKVNSTLEKRRSDLI